jgi:Pyruvate/2-oxoacid:ferredoxin oxidoreductase delta subunit
MGDLSRALNVCGLTPVLAETGAQVLDFSQSRGYEAPENKVARRIHLAKALGDVDVLISLPKLKTHGQMTFTGALKNQFGLVPGTMKGQWHFRLQETAWLAALILEINRIAHPALAIMDAVIGMEGMGPSAGKPRFIGAVLASADLTALDTLACHLIEQNPRRVPLLAAAREQNYGETHLEKICVAGDDWRECRVPGFEKPRTSTDVLNVVPLPKSALKWIRGQWTARPRIIESLCTKCRICEKGCPAEPAAIHPNADSKEKVEDERCIRCYCCHEFCPLHAIELRKPWLARRLPLTPIAETVSRCLGALRGSNKSNA